MATRQHHTTHTPTAAGSPEPVPAVGAFVTDAKVLELAVFLCERIRGLGFGPGITTITRDTNSTITVTHTA